jgi:hypothetical protein
MFSFCCNTFLTVTIASADISTTYADERRGHSQNQPQGNGRSVYVDVMALVKGATLTMFTFNETSE